MTEGRTLWTSKDGAMRVVDRGEYAEIVTTTNVTPFSEETAHGASRALATWEHARRNMRARFEMPRDAHDGRDADVAHDAHAFGGDLGEGGTR